MNSKFYFLFLILFYVVDSMSIKNNLDQEKMYILIGDSTYLVNLIENDVTTELISLLPIKTKLVEENSISKHIPLKTQVETAIPTLSSTIEANKGDLFLFKGNELILLSKPSTFFDTNGDYIKIGSISQNDNLLNSMTKNKTIFLWNTLNYENHQGKVKPYGYYNSLMNFFTWKVFTFFCFLLL